MWKKFSEIGVSVLLLLVVPAVSWAASFADLDEFNPHYVAVTFLNEKKILEGYSDGNFRPDQLVNRAESLKIIYTALGNQADLSGADLNSLFSDVQSESWFTKYIWWAKTNGLISGNPDGTFAPARVVTKAEFLKMMLEAVGFKKELWENLQIYHDVAKDAWYAPYLNYAGKSGLVTPDAPMNLYPEQSLTRAEVADIVYLMWIIVNNQDDQLLLSQAEAEQNQIEKYVTANDLVSAKRAAELAVNFTQQAAKILPEDNQVLAKAKIARAYTYLVDAFIRALEKNYVLARDLVQQTIAKAEEAVPLDPAVSEEAAHLKSRALEILEQIV